MKPPIRQILIGLVLAVIAGLVWIAWAPRRDDPRTLSGYVEGEALYLAPPISGPLTSLSVARGQRVAAGDGLFAMDGRTVSAQRDQAVADLDQAGAQALAAEASVRQLKAAAAAAQVLADNAAIDARRFRSLQATGAGAVSQQDVDRALANAASTADQARAATAQADAVAAQLAGARRVVDRARSGLAEVSTRLDYLSPRAPGPARVEEVYAQAGEWVAANQPVVSLLPDDKVKLRFFVPESEVHAYAPGRSVRFACDGCRGERSAMISYVSPRPEYTPPVIYSRKTRDSLVFLVEARPTNPRDLTPGQPVDVTPLAVRGDRP